MKEELNFLQQKEINLKKEMNYIYIDDKIERRIFWLIEDYKYIVNKLLENGMDNNSTS